jgi:hypothetical protein
MNNQNQDKNKRRKEEERKKQLERMRTHQTQSIIEQRKRNQWRDWKRERRKKDCTLGLPFVVAFQGDPAQTFFCADYPTSYELIPRTGKYNGGLERLAQYMRHHVTCLHRKVLIYKAGKKDSN